MGCFAAFRSIWGVASELLNNAHFCNCIELSFSRHLWFNDAIFSTIAEFMHLRKVGGLYEAKTSRAVHVSKHLWIRSMFMEPGFLHSSIKLRWNRSRRTKNYDKAAARWINNYIPLYKSLTCSTTFKCVLGFRYACVAIILVRMLRQPVKRITIFLIYWNCNCIPSKFPKQR